MSIKTVLSFAGLDPSGGAGIQADIETVAALGGHALPIITCNTIQNTQSFLESHTIKPNWIDRQTEHLLKDITPDSIKIGLLTSSTTVDIIKKYIPENIPVVIDPVLRSGSGSDLSNEELIQSVKKNLLPRTTIITPNNFEARTLTGYESLDQAAAKLIDYGCRFVLITGADEAENNVENHLYGQQGLIEVYHYKKLSATYHGSGCTLSAAIAILLAQGLEVETAIRKAQDFTWKALLEGRHIGKGQKHPARKAQPLTL